MKNLNLLTGLILLTLTNLVHGQENKFETGIEAGPGIGRLWGNDIIDDNMDSRITVSSGLYFQMNMKSRFSLRSGLLYERKGSSRRGNLTDDLGNNLGPYIYSGNFDYLTLPFLARLNFGKRVLFFVNVGPYFSYLLKQTDVLRNENISTFRQDDTEGFKRFDTGLSTGFGGSIPFKSGFIFSMELRNNLGLYNISKLPVWGDGTIQHHTAQLLFGLGYRFGGG